MLFQWPKLTKEREWAFQLVLTGFMCLLAGASDHWLLRGVGWFVIGCNALLYVLTLYGDYLREKLQRLLQTFSD